MFLGVGNLQGGVGVMLRLGIVAMVLDLLLDLVPGVVKSSVFKRLRILVWEQNMGG